MSGTDLGSFSDTLKTNPDLYFTVIAHRMPTELLKSRANWLIRSNGKDKIGKLNGMKSIKY